LKAVYLPAIQPSTLEERWTHRALNWLDPRLRGGPGYHPYLLASYPRWRRQRFAWEPEIFAFGDSGGFQQLDDRVRFDPCAVLRWQLRLYKVGPILDTPPFTDAAEPRSLSFRSCLRRTVEGMKRALPLYLRALDSGRDFRWWGVVHGRTPDELAEWHEALADVYPFEEEGEGWGLKPLPRDSAVAMAAALRFAQARGIRRVHFFGKGAVHPLKTLFSLGPGAGLELAMFDTSSPVTGATNFNFAQPEEFGIRWVKERYRDTDGRDTRVRDFMRYECDCVSCGLLQEDLEEYAHLADEPGYLRKRIAFHNVLALLAEYDRLQARYEGPSAAVV